MQFMLWNAENHVYRKKYNHFRLFATQVIKSLQMIEVKMVGYLSYVQRPGRSRERDKRKKEGRPWITGRNVSVQYGVAVVELIVNTEE